MKWKLGTGKCRPKNDSALSAAATNPATARADGNAPEPSKEAPVGEGVSRAIMQKHVPGSLLRRRDYLRTHRIVNGLRIQQEFTRPANYYRHSMGPLLLFSPNYAADTVYKVSVPVQGSSEKMFRLIMDVDKMPVWDAAVELCSMVEAIDDSSHVLHIVYKHPTDRTMPFWPFNTRQRDVCVTRRWRREQDGSYVILYQSTNHPDCPPQPGVVRAYLHGAGYTIAPHKKQEARAGSHSSSSEQAEFKEINLLTFIMHIDLKPHRLSLAWQRFNGIDIMDELLMNVLGIRDVMTNDVFLSGHLADELFTRRDSSLHNDNYLGPNDAELFPGHTSQRFVLNHQDAFKVREAHADSSESEPLQAATVSFPGVQGTMDPKYYQSPDLTGIKVRGRTYAKDKVKIKSEPHAAFELVGVDLFEVPVHMENIAQRPESLMQKIGDAVPFMFIVQLMVPGTPNISCVIYFAPGKNSPTRDDGSPFAKLLSEFLDGTDEDRTNRFKVIPRVVEGSWVVKQTVGNTPTILGRKLRQPYHLGPNYIEVDVDIGSSSVAGAVLGVCTPVARSLVVDVLFLLEGSTEEELPERILGAVRFDHLDLKVAATPLAPWTPEA